MKENINRNMWASYLREFSDRNKSRPTWLQVLGETGAQSEEEGLPLMGISLEQRPDKAPAVQIMLGGHDAIEPRHLTHSINNIERVRSKIALDGRDEAIEFVTADGEASLLMFKKLAAMSAHAS